MVVYGCKTCLQEILLIHSAGSDNYFHMRGVCTSVHPHFIKSVETNKFQLRIVIATGVHVGLAEWIIEDTHVLIFCFCFLWRQTPSCDRHVK